MGTLCKRNGPIVYTSSKELILGGIRSNLERNLAGNASAEDQQNAEKLMEKLSSSPRSEQVKKYSCKYT